MKKRRLPIPLILLTPIVLLVIVIVAGIYRFSLADETILAKFSQQEKKQAPSPDSVMQQVFDINTPNPWTISVPESHAFALIKQVDDKQEWASGSYDSGSDRGQVSVNVKQWLIESAQQHYLSVMTVSNQGSGVFYYLASFEYDNTRQRLLLNNAVLLGDRIDIENVRYSDAKVQIDYRQHGIDQSFADIPAKVMKQQYRLNNEQEIVTIP